MPQTRALTIHFIDGTKLSFSFPQQAADEYAILHKVEELQKHQHLVVEADGSVMIFPLSSIKYIQVQPAPTKLPSNAIRGATITD